MARAKRNGRKWLAAMFDGIVYAVFAREARALTAREVIGLVADEWGQDSRSAFERRVFRSLVRMCARRTLKRHEGSGRVVYVPAWMWRRWLKANSYTPLEMLHEAASTEYLRSTGWHL